MGFYHLHAPVAILPAWVLGLWISYRRRVKAMDTLLAGMGDSSIILMCLIFLLPYGAQILLAASLAGLSPLVLVGKAHYAGCWLR